ncbi:hypothetical protein TSUD_287120 [Trifolium subterraneum]|uniref:Uncharacterized protein n=1 Tax=Trifolium subterraneum TaxID=3900 RepID=A0A2Z6P2Q1_TRISU|nr:hypothetical protein TSUD_287120 [Trifolium subterraneum]
MTEHVSLRLGKAVLVYEFINGITKLGLRIVVLKERVSHFMKQRMTVSTSPMISVMQTRDSSVFTPATIADIDGSRTTFLYAMEHTKQRFQHLQQ